MKTLVVYSSKGGNTRKLAETAFARLVGNKEIWPVAEAPDPAGYDQVVVGFWFQGGQPDPASQEFLKKCARAGRLFLLASHGAAPDSEHARMGMNKARELAAGANIVGTFSCQGEVPAQVLAAAANNSPPPPWLKDADTAKGHPNSDDLYNLCTALENSGLAETPKPGEKRMFS
ncbi:MAG TPA: flavodoxin family protein [Desulfobulbaceae bacterium]|nr:flavodoxin family protein [Desulfobulbaceae bacterium]